MEIEENLKQLLFKDLCARLPYGIMVRAQYKDGEGWKTKLLGIYEDGQVYLNAVYTNIENIKPYLRPMSSMTEEEKEHCGDLILHEEDWMSYYDYLDSRYLDYRGLIPMGLALPATEGMYNIK